MIIKADRWPLYQRPYTDFLPDKVSAWWPCVHIFLGMGIFTMMFTLHLNPQSISSSQPWSPPGHDWVPAYSWSNSKLIFLILNNEKPWAPWRRKTEKLIDQLSLSFFKAAPYVQGIMATLRWYLISWHYPHYVRITQTSPDQTQIWGIRGSCPSRHTRLQAATLSQSFLRLFYPRLESIYLFCSGSETINWRARVDIAKWFSGSQISSETGSSRRMEPNEIETS